MCNSAIVVQTCPWGLQGVTSHTIGVMGGVRWECGKPVWKHTSLQRLIINYLY